MFTIMFNQLVILIWVDYLGVRFEVGGGKITPLSKTR